MLVLPPGGEPISRSGELCGLPNGSPEEKTAIRPKRQKCLEPLILLVAEVGVEPTR